MRPAYVIYVLLIAVSSVSCVRKAYYVTPLRANAMAYHAVPLSSEKISSATFVGGGYSGTTQNKLDYVSNYNLQVHRTHQFGKMQAVYGANGSLGAYEAKPFNEHSFFSSFLDTARINAAGKMNYGSAGIHGGMNIALPVGEFGEWRFGFRGTLQKEFGSYPRFRREFPAANVDGVAAGNMLGTLSLHTEVAVATPQGQISLKVEAGNLLGSAYSDSHFGRGETRGQRFDFLGFTAHLAVAQLGFWGQVAGGTQFFSASMGMYYRLQATKRRK